MKRMRVRHLLPVLLLLAVVATYAPVLWELVKDWRRDPNYHHGFLIPAISFYLLWMKRKEFGPWSPSPATAGLVGILLAGALFVFGTAGAEVFTQRIGFLILIGSLAVFVYGLRVLRLIAFPVAYLAFAIPLPYVLYYRLTAPMQAFAARSAIWSLHISGIPAIREGNTIHLPNVSLEVADACSGIRSLYAFLAIGALVARSTPLPRWGRAVVLLSTIPLAVAGNALRVWGSGMAAWAIGPEAATGFIHELFGILVFILSLGAFFLVRKAAGKLWSSAGSSPSSLLDFPESTPRISGRGRSSKE